MIWIKVGKPSTKIKQKKITMKNELRTERITTEVIFQWK